MVTDRIFDEVPRHDLDRPVHGEPHFAYLNRSARPMAGRVRDVLEQWLEVYPAEHRTALRDRLRSIDDTEHTAAVHELMLHELHRRMGVPAEVHALIAGSKRPDFLATCSTHGRSYVEAVGTTLQSADERARTQVLNDIYRAMVSVESPEFWLGVRPRGLPSITPSLTAFKRDLAKWVAALDVDSVRKALQAGHRMRATRPFVWRGGGCHIEIFPTMAKSGRGSSSLGIGMYFDGGSVPDTRPAVRRRLTKKAGRYKVLGAPYVVALNLRQKYWHHVSMVEVLFGDELLVDRGKGAREGRWNFKLGRNGVWTHGSTPSWTRLSGVLATEQLTAWNLGRADAILYLNPWAEHPYKCELTRLPRVLVRRGRLVRETGISLGELLGLPPGWPGED